MSLEALIATYGYGAVGIGTFLEGETILILGGVAAHRGYLQLPWVIFCAFLGTLLGDQLAFSVGRARGRGIYGKARAEKIFSLLTRHQTGLLLGFRFLYGLRTITPFLIGAAGIAPSRFLLFNSIGASLWAIVIGAAGYLFGYTLEFVIRDIKQYELLVFALLAGIAIVVWSVKMIKRRASGAPRERHD